MEPFPFDEVGKLLQRHADHKDATKENGQEDEKF